MNEERDPLDAVFMTDVEILADYLKKMPEYLKPVFKREFTRIKKKEDKDASAEVVKSEKCAT